MHYASRLYEALLAESIDEIAVLVRLFSEGELTMVFLDKLCEKAHVGLGAQDRVKSDLLRALTMLKQMDESGQGRASMAGGGAAPAAVVPPKESVRMFVARPPTVDLPAAIVSPTVLASKLSKYCQSLPDKKMSAAGLAQFYAKYPELKGQKIKIKVLCQDHLSLLTWIDDESAHGKGWICAADCVLPVVKGT